MVAREIVCRKFILKTYKMAEDLDVDAMLEESFKKPVNKNYSSYCVFFRCKLVFETIIDIRIKKRTGKKNQKSQKKKIKTEKKGILN